MERPQKSKDPATGMTNADAEPLFSDVRYWPSSISRLTQPAIAQRVQMLRNDSVAPAVRMQMIQ